MLPVRGRLRFALEALGALRVIRQVLGQDLDRGVAIQARLARAIDLTHRFRAKRAEDRVVR